ncbi:MAG: UbiA family prenyltransferase [Candidatus Aminicenantes bacterium]|nr:UbiA family prenyltransferase [Candidatus Aminicenantes bacterium]
MTAYFKAMRLGRWPRSLAVFVGSAAFLFLDKDLMLSAGASQLFTQGALAFLLTWAISTANYIVNEIVDAPYDIHHPLKRNRPLVKGEIRKIPFLVWGAILSISSLAAAYVLFCPPFFFSLFALLIAGFVYNIKPIRTKDIPFLDSISESANNPIRFLIGWFAFSPPEAWPPVSLLVCWWAFGNFLMIAKRLSEFRFLKEKAGDYRNSLKRYSEKSLVFGMIFSSIIFFATYFTFVIFFRLHFFLYLSPLLLFYFYLFFRKTLKEDEVMEEPERLFTHTQFALYTLLLILLFLIAALLEKPLH